jgi:hypothetical protein
MRQCSLRFAAFMVLALVACGERPPVVITPVSALPSTEPVPASTSGSATSKPPPPLRASGPFKADTFGGKRFGFAEGSSKNGRLVFLRRFQGSARPTFGQHGESSTPTDLTLFDRVDGRELPIDELLDVADRRYFLVLEGGALRVIDAASGASTNLDGVDMADDANLCLPPRQGGFSEGGKRVGWVTSGGLAVRDLESGVTWTVMSSGRLWRGWPDDTGRGATLAEVTAAGADWPRQNTSCACRWCGRFAMSHGMYGWSGPTFAIEHVDDAGARKKGVPPKSGPRDGATDGGCTLRATAGEDLEEGPWRWDCKSGG